MTDMDDTTRRKARERLEALRAEALLPEENDAEPEISPDGAWVDLETMPEAHLAALGDRFMGALELCREGAVAEAERWLKEILKAEPRLAEPHLELARLRIEAEDFEEAEHHAREAVRLLESGGAWCLDLEEESLQSLAHGMLAEVLRCACGADDGVLADPDRFREKLREARRHYERAAELDPENEHAAFYAFHLSLDAESQVQGDGEG